MIDLYQHTPRFNLPNLCPFCMKVEAFLRIAELPFQIIDEDDLDKTPDGHLPYIRDNGVVISDAELIIDYLESRLGFHVDGHLDSQKAAIHHAFVRMLEGHLHWALLYSRYLEDHNWETLQRRIFAEVPPPISTFQANRMRKELRDQLHHHGMGKLNRDDVYKKGGKDLAALAVLLGDHPWFGGDYVSRLDLTATAYLANILVPELPSPLADKVREYSNLASYAARSLRLLYPNEPRKPKRPAF
jgi:glutathione S-transferase